MNEREVATFNCTATGVGDLTIEWDVDGCSKSTTNCGSINSESGDGYVTSTLNITGVTDLNISCVVNQNLTFSSEDPSIEIRLPLNRTRTVQGNTVQLMIIPATPTAQPTTTQGSSVGPSDGKKDDILL